MEARAAPWGERADHGTSPRSGAPIPTTHPTHHGCTGCGHRAAPRGCRAGAHGPDEGAQGLVHQALLGPVLGDQVPEGGGCQGGQGGGGLGSMSEGPGSLLLG